MERVYPESRNQDQCQRKIVDTLEGDEAFIIVDWTMKFIAMKFREKQAEWFPKREINWHVSSVVVRQEESLEVTWYVHLLNSCKQDWFSVLSILENLFVTIKLRNSVTIKAFLRSDEAGCYHNSKLVSSLRGLGHQDYHFQQLTQEGLRVWRAFNVGSGKFIR